jgi:hypothetical protein
MTLAVNCSHKQARIRLPLLLINSTNARVFPLYPIEENPACGPKRERKMAKNWVRFCCVWQALFGLLTAGATCSAVEILAHQFALVAPQGDGAIWWPIPLNAGGNNLYSLIDAAVTQGPTVATPSSFCSGIGGSGAAPPFATGQFEPYLLTSLRWLLRLDPPHPTSTHGADHLLSKAVTRAADQPPSKGFIR